MSFVPTPGKRRPATGSRPDRKNAKKILALFLGLAALGAAPSFSEPTPTATPSLNQVVDNLSDFIRQQMDKAHVKGLSIALVEGKDIVWAGGFGWADEAAKVRATADTLYHVGAVSKILTAAEVLKLSEEGRVGLDEPIERYVPGFSIHSRFKNAKSITVRSLLANHSGLPGFYLKGLWVEKPESLESLVGNLKSDYLVSPPQTLYKYSYVDYDLLGRLVEIREGKPFAQAMRQDLLEPLGMGSSTFDGGAAAGLAKGYRKGKEMPPLDMRDTPAAGLVSSAGDLAKFIQGVFNGGTEGKAPLGPRALKEMFKPQYPGLPFDFGHKVAMGWMLDGLPIPGSKGTAWHEGQYPPYVAEVAVLDKRKLGVVVLSNTEEAEGVVDDISIRALKLMLESRYGVPEDLEKKKPVMPPTVRVPQERLDAYAGTYSALGQLTDITRQGDHLSADLSGHRLDLLPVLQDTFIPHLVFLLFFSVDLPQYPLTFQRIEGKDVATLGGLRYPVPLEKIAPVPIPAAWKNREGDYVLENPDGQVGFRRVSLKEEDGFLESDMRVSFPAFGIQDREFKVALLPLSDDDAVVPGLFYGDGGTLHAVDGKGGTRVFYSGYWFRKAAEK